jgi:hypothetical protein
MDEKNLPKSILTVDNVLLERPNWTTEQAQAWLKVNKKNLSEVMFWAGENFMRRLLDTHHPRGEFCECCEDFFDAADMVGDTCKHCVEYIKGRTSANLQQG